jgi:hypothetical protein
LLICVAVPGFISGFCFFSKICSLLDLIETFGFRYSLHTSNSQIQIFSRGLSPELQLTQPTVLPPGSSRYRTQKRGGGRSRGTMHSALLEGLPHGNPSSEMFEHFLNAKTNIWDSPTACCGLVLQEIALGPLSWS